MIFLWDNKIYLYEAIILSCLWPLYIIVNVCFFTENHQELQNDKENLLENEKLNEIFDDQEIK
jgi:uncharacterized membrane protein YqjE